jgi:hypothetical protein
LPIGAHTSITTYEPNGVSLWNATDSTITPIYVGDGYDIRVDFRAKTTSVVDYASFTLDIGTFASPIQVTTRTFTFPKGQNVWHSFSFGFPIYTLETFIANGAKIKFQSGVGDLDISEQLVFIKKDYCAK